MVKYSMKSITCMNGAGYGASAHGMTANTIKNSWYDCEHREKGG